jgi:hypothetical protein
VSGYKPAEQLAAEMLAAYRSPNRRAPPAQLPRNGFTIVKCAPGWVVQWPQEQGRPMAAFSTWDEMMAWLNGQPRPSDESAP